MKREAWIWVVALIGIFIVPMEGKQSLCIFHHIGWPCLGCGLAHSMQAALHGHLLESMRLHPMGMPAIVILLFRICHLTKHTYHESRFNPFTTGS